MLRILWGTMATLVVLTGSLAADEPLKGKPAAPAEKSVQPKPVVLHLQAVQAEGAKPVVVQLKGAQTEAVQKDVEELLKKLREQQGDSKPQPKTILQAKNPNQEVIDLLKQILQKLEGQQGSEAKWTRINPYQAKQATPELDKARAEVKAAEAQLAEARARLAKLEGGMGDRIFVQPRFPVQPPPGGFKKPIQAPVPKPPVPPPVKGGGDLEKRLEKLIQEVDALRKEIHKGK